MIDTPIRSPYGEVEAVLQWNTTHVIRVRNKAGSVRYFRSDNWTYFELDAAEELSKVEFVEFNNKLHQSIMAELERRKQEKSK